jgi:sporulation protein YqfC
MSGNEKRRRTEKSSGGDGRDGGRSVLAVLVRAMELPEDLEKGNVLVSIQGQERIVVENFKGISSYTDGEIRLLTRKKKLCITGRNLVIENYTKEEVTITGYLERVEYVS